MDGIDFSKLDETLQLLDGLHDDPLKRKEICKYIKENNHIAVFCYGSLLWFPVEPYDDKICDCTLNGYRKGFICEDFIYRGTKRFTGLTLGLEKDPQGYVKGGLLISAGHNIIPFIEAFVKRETPVSVKGIKMDIYRYDFVKILMPDNKPCRWALTCMVNEKSSFHLTPRLTLDEQAKKMSMAYGQNGTNLQYLQRTINTYNELKLKDSCTYELEELYRKVIFYRMNLSKHDQEWLRTYDELQTVEERRRAVKFYTLATSQTSIEPHLSRSTCIQRLFSQISQVDVPQSA